MTKQELATSVANQTGLGAGAASRAVQSVLDTIGEALGRGEEVRLMNFGTFSTSRRKASAGRNPRTGEPLTIKASAWPKFKAGKGLKDALK